jgi:hypothetical protein
MACISFLISAISLTRNFFSVYISQKAQRFQLQPTVGWRMSDQASLGGRKRGS